MINVKIEVIKPDNKKYDITNSVTKVSWKGDYKQSARTLSFSTVTSTLDVNVPSFDIPVGSKVIFYENNKELFRGMIFSREMSDNIFSFNCYDDGIRLLKIKGYYNFKNKSVQDICNTLCKDYNIPKGTFASVSTKITKVFIGVSLYDIIMTCYTEASKSTGKKYMCIFKDGKVHVIEKGTSKLSITFEEKNNIEKSSYSESVENMVNKVVVVTDEGAVKSSHSNKDDINAFGLFQEVIKYSEDSDSSSEAKSKLKGIEQTASLTGYGNTSCTTGYGVTIKDTTSSLVGLFYIESDEHVWENGNYSIDLNLNFKNIMHEVTSGQEESKTSSSSSSSNSSSSSSSSSNSKASKIVSLAKSKVGNKYVWGSTGPSTFDCSGLVYWCYKQLGITLPRTSKEQSKYGKSVSKSNLQEGDLLFFSTNGTGQVSHVGIYVGGGKMVHAANSRSGVRYDNIDSSYYKRTYKNSRRVL